MYYMETLAGRYRLLETLGEGGMALVYKAQDLLLERVVAVKVLREQWAADADFVARFRQEARAAARLSHPNIVAIYDVGEEAGRHYIIMEYVEGTSLKEELGKGPLNLFRAVQVGVQICAGLQYAYQKGVVHRDIKPHNILLSRDLAKIADFGIARALGAASQTLAGEVLGSPHYLSPEQVKGQEATGSSDIYSLGALLYEAVTGRPPFQGESPLATALKHVEQAPTPPRRLNQGVPSVLESIILRALAKEPKERYASAAQMGQALADCAARSQEETTTLRPGSSAPVPAVPAATPQVTIVSTRRRTGKAFPWLFLAVALALVALVGGLTLLSPGLVRRYLGEARGSNQPPVVLATPTVAPTASPTVVPTAVPLVLVPGVTGMLPLDARILVEGQGLTYRETGKDYSSDVQEGRILRQGPSAGASLSRGSVVTVTVSLGPALAQVPRLIDLTLNEAEVRLKDLGLRADVKETWHQTVPVGGVLQQVPLPGATLARGGVVMLTVSMGREKVAVPDVVGLPEERAQRSILEARLRNFLYVNYQGRDVLPPQILAKVCVGCVLSTTPAPGEMVEPGTEIKMAVRKD